MTDIKPATDAELAEYLELHRRETDDGDHGYWGCDLDANVTVRQILARIEAQKQEIAALQAERDALDHGHREFAKQIAALKAEPQRQRERADRHEKMHATMIGACRGMNKGIQRIRHGRDKALKQIAALKAEITALRKQNHESAAKTDARAGKVEGELVKLRALMAQSRSYWAEKLSKPEGLGVSRQETACVASLMEDIAALKAENAALRAAEEREMDQQNAERLAWRAKADAERAITLARWTKEESR